MRYAISAILGASAVLGVLGLVRALRSRQEPPLALPDVFSWWEANGADMLEHFITSTPAWDTLPEEWSA